MLEPVRLNEWMPVAEQVWEWAQDESDNLVDEYTEGFLEPRRRPAGWGPLAGSPRTN